MSLDDEEPDPPKQRRGYVICTTQRAGSNYLCQLLTASGVLGRPLDYFNAEGQRQKGWDHYPAEPEEQLAVIEAHGATDNQVYGFKLFGHDVEALGRTGWTARLPNLHWVFLERENLLDQAISLVIAKQTGQWRSSAPARDQPVYDGPSIARELAELARTNGLWRGYFARNGLRPCLLSYEALVADPDRAISQIAALMAVACPKTVSRGEGLQRQSTARNGEWRARFIAEGRDVSHFEPGLEPHSWDAPPTDVDTFASDWEERLTGAENEAEHQDCGDVHAPSFWYAGVMRIRPKLTVSIQTKNSALRLPRLLAEVSGYADEILVGVDAASEDDTLGVAAAMADRVYRFRLPRDGHLAPARTLPFRLATGDWLLCLDDDEGMDEHFEALLPDLMAAEGVTHHHFPRKWIVQQEPGLYLHCSPWFPNWSRRMIRNDPSIVWKPTEPHSQYFVQGPGHYESRTSILHFEPLLCAPDRRQEKISAYREAGAQPASERFYDHGAGVRRPVRLRAQTIPAPRPQPGAVDAQVYAPELLAHAPWGANIRRVRMDQSAAPGQNILFEAIVENTGQLAWSPSFAQWPTQEWPMLRLSYHVLRHDGAMHEPDGRRYLVKSFVPIAGEVTFIDEFTAPERPGDYIIEWDMLSETECWFADCGGATFQTLLRVGGPGAD